MCFRKKGIKRNVEESRRRELFEREGLDRSDRDADEQDDAAHEAEDGGESRKREEGI